MKAKSVKMFAIKIGVFILFYLFVLPFLLWFAHLIFYFIDITYNLISHHSLSSQNIDKIASGTDLFAKKVCAKEIFGSHLLLGEKTLRACAPDADSFSADSLADSGGNHWDALRASRIYWLSLMPPTIVRYF